MIALRPDAAQRYARTARENLVREYPCSLGHLLLGDEDLKPPRMWHPAFWGSYDWHSAVHQMWMLVRLQRVLPHLAVHDEVGDLLEERLTERNIAVEIGVFESRPWFERPYGWVWLLALQAELSRNRPEQADVVLPLARLLRRRLLDLLRSVNYPNRTGLHGNTAFAAVLLDEIAEATEDEEARNVVRDLVTRAYLGPPLCPAATEPSGTDFLSPTLLAVEAVGRTLQPAAFVDWLHSALPEPGVLLAPVVSREFADPQASHLVGLNLTRSWGWSRIAAWLPVEHPLNHAAAAAVTSHADAAAEGLESASFATSHWVSTYAVRLATGDLSR